MAGNLPLKIMVSLVHGLGRSPTKNIVEEDLARGSKQIALPRNLN